MGIRGGLKNQNILIRLSATQIFFFLNWANNISALFFFFSFGPKCSTQDLASRTWKSLPRIFFELRILFIFLISTSTQNVYESVSIHLKFHLLQLAAIIFIITDIQRHFTLGGHCFKLFYSYFII